MKRSILSLGLAVIFAIGLLPVTAGAQTINFNGENSNSKKSISSGGYTYSASIDNKHIDKTIPGSGIGSMSIEADGSFSCEWAYAEDVQFNKFKTFDRSRTHSEIGNISVDFDVNISLNEKNRAFTAVHATNGEATCNFTITNQNNLYIVENWENNRPVYGIKKGTFDIDGGTYDIYEEEIIANNNKYIRYWSVRTEKRESGTVSVSKHLDELDKLGFNLGLIYNIGLTFQAESVDSLKSSGNITVSKMELNIDEIPLKITTLPAGDNKYTFRQMKLLSVFSSNTTASFNIHDTLIIDSPKLYGHKEVIYLLPDNINLSNCEAVFIK